MITVLVTGASGLVGRSVIKSLVKNGIDVHALVHRESQVPQMEKLGVNETFVGDMSNPEDMRRALQGADMMYYICSAGNQNEYEMGQIAIDAAKEAGLKHFVYHSVLHSVLREMPHHRQKNDIENALVNSGLRYTIVQPAAFMQNLISGLGSVESEGVWHQKFYTDDSTALCMVDADDLGDAVAVIASDPDAHAYATYEIAGPENLTLDDVLNALRDRYGRDVRAEFIPDETLVAGLEKSGVDEYKKDMMLKMFRHYNEHSFTGNPQTLTSLVQRPPRSLSDFLESV